jgi:hypothetical protein
MIFILRANFSVKAKPIPMQPPVQMKGGGIFLSVYGGIHGSAIS